MRPHVLLSTDLVGGVWDFCCALSAELAVRGWRVSLLALGAESAEHRRQAEQAGAELVFAPLKLEWMQDAEPDVQRTREVAAELVAQLRPDVVHANQFAVACADVAAPVVLTVHSDVLSWRKWTLGSLSVPEEWAGYVHLVHAALRRADAVVAVSQFLADEVEALYAIQRPIQAIHNGWPPHFAQVAPKAESPVTLVAGRAWDVAKNVLLAAEAARGWDPGPVYLAGDQHHPDSGGAIPVAAPIQPLGHLTRQQLDTLLLQASIYLSPARYDPFGLLPLQAALAGCALLLADIPSYRELWDGAALFFRSDDPIDLRLQWAHLIGDARLRSELARRAARRAAERYTSAGMAEAYLALYTRLSALSSVPAEPRGVPA